MKLKELVEAIDLSTWPQIKGDWTDIKHDLGLGAKKGSSPYWSWNKKDGKKLFWDFYATWYLWSWVGGGLESYFGKSPDINAPFTGKFAKKPFSPYDIHGKVPHQKSQDVIDRVFKSVLQTTSEALIFYLKRACLLELQHFSGQTGFGDFVQNVKGHITNKSIEEVWNIFKETAKKIYPDLDPDFLYRLIGWQYYLEGSYKSTYDKLKASYDYNINKEKGEKEKKEKEKQDLEKWLSEPGDDTGLYDIEKEPEIPGDVDIPPEGEEIPDYPYNEPETTPTPFHKDPSYTSHDIYWKPESDDEKKKRSKEKLYEIGSEDYNLEKVESKAGLQRIRKIHNAMKKAGMTMQDAVNAYDSVFWGEHPSFGGLAWGEGMASALELEDLIRKSSWTNEEMKDIAYSVDKIYDLNHNTGKLLNKGYIKISQKDLDSRSKAKSVARMIPHVSPNIKRLILRYLPYMGVTEEDANMEAAIKKPTAAFTPEESAQLKKLSFKDKGNGVFQGAYQWESIKRIGKNKKTEHQTTELFLRKHTDGTYTFNDALMSDLKGFSNIEEAIKYIQENYNNAINKLAQTYVSSEPAPENSAQAYISSHEKTKLNVAQEKMLKSLNFEWRENSKRYRAKSPDGNSYSLHAFVDGTFLYVRKNDLTTTGNHKIFTSFAQAFNHLSTESKGKTVPLSPEIQPAPIAPTPTPPPAPSAAENIVQGLSPEEINKLNAIIHEFFPVNWGVKTDILKKNMVGLISPSGVMQYFNVYNINPNIGKPYVITHLYKKSNEAFFKENFYFETWDEVIEFIVNNNDKLATHNPIAIGTGDVSTPTAIPTSNVNKPKTPASAPGAIFSKSINKAGLYWNNDTGLYVDKVNGHILKIEKNGNSTIIYSNGEERNFGTFTSLIQYLANYPETAASKKGTTSTPTPTTPEQPASSFPDPTIIKILEGSGFKKKSDDAFTNSQTWHWHNTSTSYISTVVLWVGGAVTYVNDTGAPVSFNNWEQFKGTVLENPVYPEHQSYKKYIEGQKGQYSKSYYDDVKPNQNGHTIRLKEEDENILNNYGFKWVNTGGEAEPGFKFVIGGYWNWEKERQIIFYNKSLSANDVHPAATIADKSGAGLIDLDSIDGALKYIQKYFTPNENETLIDYGIPHGLKLLSDIHKKSLEDRGYQWYPNDEIYYNPENDTAVVIAGTIHQGVSQIDGVKFYQVKDAKLFMTSFATVEEVLQYIDAYSKSHPSTQEPEKKEEHDYNTMEQDGVHKVTELIPEDEEKLKNVGFEKTTTYGFPLYSHKDESNFSAYNDDTANFYDGKSGANVYIDKNGPTDDKILPPSIEYGGGISGVKNAIASVVEKYSGGDKGQGGEGGDGGTPPPSNIPKFPTSLSKEYDTNKKGDSVFSMKLEGKEHALMEKLGYGLLGGFNGEHYIKDNVTVRFYDDGDARINTEGQPYTKYTILEALQTLWMKAYGDPGDVTASSSGELIEGEPESKELRDLIKDYGFSNPKPITTISSNKAIEYHKGDTNEYLTYFFDGSSNWQLIEKGQPAKQKYFNNEDKLYDFLKGGAKYTPTSIQEAIEEVKKLGFEEKKGLSIPGVDFYKKDGNTTHQVIFDKGKMTYRQFHTDEDKNIKTIKEWTKDVDEGLRQVKEEIQPTPETSKSEDTSKVPYSGTDYKEKYKNLEPHKVIELNMDDEHILEKIGFEKMGSEYNSWWYQKGQDQLQFYADGIAKLWEYTEEGGYTVKKFNTVIDAMQYVWDKYKKSPGDIPPLKESAYKTFINGGWIN